ncbi:MAG: cation diffusion facilitator family transporter [Ancalomicrobiaceae bacterium]|nr:cation diffusion facilitator family transporter [Ancalomicrobiaceae bacterium]
MDGSLKIALGSFGVSFAVLAIKYVAYLLTGSVALYSDALESIINVATAVAAIVAIRIAARPSDAQHPYGHHKAEYISAAIVGVMIVVAAVTILHEAWLGFVSPKQLEALGPGLAVSAVATALNALWSATLIRQGRINRSAALVADGKHLFADVVTSLAVLVGVGLVMATGIIVLDAAIAALVAVNVLWSGYGVIRESLSSLMDETAPEKELTLIREAIRSAAIGAVEVHDLRTRHAGKATFVDFHLVVPSTMTTGEAHQICERIELAIVNELAGAKISIHVEPEHEAHRDNTSITPLAVPA